MNHMDRDVAGALLSMPSEEFHKFVRDAIRQRRLGTIVHSLNEQALSKSSPDAPTARQALERIGFSE